MKTIIEESTVERTSNVFYGILDNECGTLVDCNDEECGDFGYDAKIIAGEERLVVSILSTHDNKKALFRHKTDAESVKWLLEQKHPDNSYSLISFTECVHKFYELNVLKG